MDGTRRGKSEMRKSEAEFPEVKGLEKYTEALSSMFKTQYEG